MDKNDPRREPTEEELDALNEHWHEPGDPDGVVAADEQKQWQEQHPVPVPVQPVASYRKKRRWPVILLVVVLIVAAAVGAYLFGSRKAAAPPVKTTSSNNQPTKQKPKTKTATTPTKHYNSATYSLDFDYPQTWTVSDTASKLTVISPATQLTGLDGVSVSGHVVVTIQNKQSTIAGYPANGAVAELASDKLTYTKPTSVQRAQTYLSYLGYHKTNGLDALFITGDSGYQQGQQVPLSDIIVGDPLISVTFETCTTDDCSGGMPTAVTLLASSWKSTSSSKQVTDLLQSIQLN